MKTLRLLILFILVTILSSSSIYSQGVISRPTNATKESKKAKKQSSYLYFAGNKTTTNIEFPFNGGNQTINVSSRESIHLHSNASWISASVSGSKIIITCQANYEPYDRNAEIAVKAGNKTIYAYVRQSMGFKIENIQFAGSLINDNKYGFTNFGESINSQRDRYLIPKIYYTIKSSASLSFNVKLTKSGSKTIYQNYYSVPLYANTYSTILDGIDISGIASGRWNFEVYYENTKIYSTKLDVNNQNLNTTNNNYSNSAQSNNNNYNRQSSNTYNNYYQSNNNRIYPSNSDTYPKKNFYIGLGCVALLNPFSIGGEMTLGFNVKRFNMDLNIIPPINKYVGMQLLFGYNTTLNRRFKFTPQIGFGMRTGEEKDLLGGVVGFRYDLLLRKHITFYVAPHFLIGVKNDINKNRTSTGYDGTVACGFTFYL